MEMQQLNSKFPETVADISNHHTTLSPDWGGGCGGILRVMIWYVIKGKVGIPV